MAAEQIAVTGNARYRGIPATTITFGTPGNQTVGSATGNTLTVFTSIEKTLEADIADSRNNDNEVVARSRSNKRIRMTFSASPIGATRDAAITVAENCPYPGDVAVLTCTEDTQIASSEVWIDSASCSWTPDGELVMAISCTEFSQDLAPAS